MDILSDDSDSFFEDPKVIKAKKTTLQTKTEKSKSMQNLFGISQDKITSTPSTLKESSAKGTVNKDVDWLGLGDDLLKEDQVKNPTETLPKAKIATPSKITSKFPKKISFEDDEDLLVDLGLDNKSKKISEEKTFAAKKTAIMEDLLGGTKQEEEKISSFDDILQTSRAKTTRQLDSISGSNEIEAKDVALTSLKPSGTSAGYAPSSAGKEGRRSRHGTPNVIDPLGIFSSTFDAERTQEHSVTNEQEKQTSINPRQKSQESISSKKGRNILSQKSISLDFESDVAAKPTSAPSKLPNKLTDAKASSSPNLGLPNWLGGGSSASTTASKANKSETVVSIEEQSKPVIQAEQQQSEAENAPPTTSTHFINKNFLSQSQDSLLAQHKLSSSNLEYQNSQIALQQQESQVLMALQLKKYEDGLAETQRSQQELIMKQEQQFNAVLERQFAKQQMMENNMRLQQERINSHIQLLISQPPVYGERLSESEKQREEIRKATLASDAEDFKETVNNLKQKHQEELFLMEESYKKQISLLEHNMESVESRLKQETASVTEHYNEKIKQLTVEHEAETKKYNEKIEQVRQSHLAEIKTMRENHTRVCEEIRFQYSTMVENIKESLKTEKSMSENSEQYTERLNESMKLLDSNNRVLHHIKDELESTHQTNALSKEESLRCKEEDVKAMKAGLEKAQEQMQMERIQLFGLIRSLETKLAEQTQASREEQWALQQATVVLTARSTALDREIEFARSAAEREQEQIKVLKETLLAEQQRDILQLTEQKLALAAEKSKLDTSSKLSNNYDVSKARAEIDAAIQVAKEATEMTDRERELLHKQQCDMESLKRKLRDLEFKLKVKERDLEQLEKSGTQKIHEGQRMMEEARNIEMKYTEKMREIQSQLQALKMRERKMNEDKIYLSKERLALQQSIVKANKRCGLCSVEKNSDDHVSYSENVAELETPKYSISNPELLRFRLSLGLGDENGETNYENDHL